MGHIHALICFHPISFISYYGVSLAYCQSKAVFVEEGEDAEVVVVVVVVVKEVVVVVVEVEEKEGNDEDVYCFKTMSDFLYFILSTSIHMKM